MDSVWRPLTGPTYDWPLAVCDYTSLNTSEDLIASDNVYTHTIAETYNVLFQKRHRWYYVNGMCSDEVLVFKAFDSKASKGNARSKQRRVS